MPLTSRHFYQFSGVHSLVIGLLPFFLPVLLWEREYSLASIAAFIALTGLGFIGTLWCWDKLREAQQWKTMIALSFLAEVVLVGLLTLETSLPVFLGLALINGAYNCFYWSTQRAMFIQVTHEGNTGRTFGNIQMLVVILLKVGILVGGYMLDHFGSLPILFASLAIVSAGLWKMRCLDAALPTPPSPRAHEPALGLKDIRQFNDNHRSRLIFLLDGPFLFLESYFWVLSLYFLTQQSFFTLGLVVVSLTLMLSIAFYFIKNVIDRIQQAPLFFVAVALYAVSWFLRGNLSLQDNEETTHIGLYATLLLIGFLTTFFRLVFNKRFFDLARQTTSYRYLLCKSYYSQWSIALVFGLIAGILALHVPAHTTLSYVYFVACPVSLAYVAYMLPSHQHTSLSAQAPAGMRPLYLSFTHSIAARHARLVNKR